MSEVAVVDSEPSGQPLLEVSGPSFFGDFEELVFDRDDPCRVLPTHKLSGLPLVVLPIESRNADSEKWEDFDHRNYPRTRWELRGVGGSAVRCSSGQDLPRWLHNRKHSVFPNGPVLPRTNATKYISCVLSCADYIPRQAIDLTRDGSYDIVEMTDAQIEDLARSRTIHIEDANHANTGSYYRHIIGKFFAYYAISQDLSHISPAVIDEFLHTESAARRKELGNLLLVESVDVSLEPVRLLQNDLRDQGLVRLRRRDPHETVVRKFFVKSRFPDYHSELQRRLRMRQVAA